MIFIKKLLLVIDVQYDFINDITKKYVKKIEKIINSNEFDDVVFTKFINDKNSKWYNELNYKGCINEKGQQIVIDTKNYKIIEKKIYSSLSLDLINYIKKNKIDKIYLCGFETNACVFKTALDLFEKNYDLYILKDYCMSMGGVDLHNIFINNLSLLIGKDRII